MGSRDKALTDNYKIIMFLKYTKWAMLWALLILILCGMPGKGIPHISFLELLSFDKFVHASIFFIFILLSIRGYVLQTQFSKLKQNAKPAAFWICVAYGGLMEVMQGTLFIDRSADVYDFIANSFGCTMGWVFYNLIERKFW
ncbi:MAG TPA: VanZ family protein [Bacteroidia bacterium]|nr:VanZ family protein [Bacteroidia bacterium]